MHVQELQGKKVLIVGYGKEGKVTEQYLRAHLDNVNIKITDAREGDTYLDHQNDFDIIVKTPGLHRSAITAPYTTATNLFFANKGDNMVIGVTGSKGKSTTSSLITHMLKAAGRDAVLIGNIGVPALSALMETPPKERIFVYELSSYQLEDIAYSPHIAVIVSLFPEHMTYHGSLDAYYSAKKNILTSLTSHDYFVFNQKYPQLGEWAAQCKAQCKPYDSVGIPRGISLLGEHNRDNIRAAMTVSRILGLPDDLSLQSVLSFQPLPHRLQCVGEFRDITFYDDAISTTPESTIAALRAISGVSTLFLGGEDRGYDFTPLIQELKHHPLSGLVLFPQSGKKILALLQKEIHPFPPILETDSMKEAVQFAYEHTPKGSVCLLSTASPSYSVWKDFEEKGNQFQQFIRELSLV